MRKAFKVLGELQANENEVEFRDIFVVDDEVWWNDLQDEDQDIVNETTYN